MPLLSQISGRTSPDKDTGEVGAYSSYQKVI